MSAATSTTTTSRTDQRPAGTESARGWRGASRASSRNRTPRSRRSSNVLITDGLSTSAASASSAGSSSLRSGGGMSGALSSLLGGASRDGVSCHSCVTIGAIVMTAMQPFHAAAFPRLTQLAARNELASPHGRLMTGVVANVSP